MIRSIRFLVRLLTVLSCLFFLKSFSQALSITPYANLTALGGQYFNGQTHSTGANVDGSLVPTVKVNKRLYVYPIYFGSYHETQSVYQFLGEKTLIQRQLDLQGVLRADWIVVDNWIVTPRAGYKQEWAKQTQDDSLWNGLFKYNRVFGGASLRHQLTRGSLELGAEYGVTKYPNYQSLSSDPRLVSTGLTTASGRDVLNFRSTETSLIYDRPSKTRRSNMYYNFTWICENFSDQKVMTTGSSGTQAFTGADRTDDILSLSIRESFRASERWLLTATETALYYMSNQNAFDATQLQASPFTPRYYNFGEFQLSRSTTLFLDHSRLALTLSGSIGYRKYWERRAQDGSGNFQDKRIYSLNRGVTVTVKYRLIDNLNFVFTGSALTYSSNTRFEANYPYNYSVYNYLGGLSWEFH